MNGTTIIDDKKLNRATAGAIDENESGPGPIVLQAHSTVGQEFRNISIQPISKSSNRPKSLKPILYLSGDTDTPSIPSKIQFARMEGDFVDGKIGKGVKFNGKQFSEFTVKLPTGNSPRSLALWIKNNRGPVKDNIHIFNHGPLEKAKPFGLMEASGNWRFFDLNGGLDSERASDKGWHHHAITFDGDSIRYYLDGNKIAEVQRKLSTESGVVKIGGLGDPKSNFIGVLDEIYFFDVALSDTQVKQLFEFKNNYAP